MKLNWTDASRGDWVPGWLAVLITIGIAVFFYVMLILEWPL